MSGLQILAFAALISATQLLLFAACGIGLARLLLPNWLRAHELALAPAFGLALLALLGYYGAQLGMTMRQLLPVALAVALVLVGVAFTPREQRRLHLLPWRELAALLALLAGAWVLNLAPVIHYRALLPIGINWDIEFYLPLAEYLKDFSYASLASAPANPLRLVVLADPTFSRAMGATYAQAMADLIGGWDSWASWVPMLALLRVLSLCGLYTLLREGLGVRPAGALAGVALAGANSLLLWTTYNSFGMGLGGLALLPAALVCLLAALEQRSLRVALGAGVLLGGLTCTYWPMLMVYAIAGGGMALALLWERREGDWPAVLGRGILVVFVGALLGLLANLRAPAAFLGVFADKVASMGITAFISPATIAGSAPMPWDAPSGSTAPAVVLAWIGLAAAAMLGAAGLWYGSARRALAIGLATASVGYLLALQYAVRFPYGFLRGASYINTLLLGLVGAGLLVFPWRWPQRLPRSLPLLTATLAFVLALASVNASLRTYAAYAPRPALFSAEAANLRAELAKLDRPGPISISPAAATALCDTAFTPWAYALLKREIVGVAGTGYTLMRNSRPGVAPAYLLLARGEDPGEYALAEAVAVWQNELVAVYAAPPTQVAWLNGRASNEGEPPLCGQGTTTYGRAQLGLGGYAEATPDRPLKLFAGASMLGWAPLSGEAARRELVLALASFAPQHIEVQLGAERRELDLPAGLSIHQVGAVSVPAQISIHVGTGPVVLRWASLEAADVSGAKPSLQPDDRTLLISLRSQPRPGGAAVELQTQNDTAQLLRYAIEIYEDRAGYREAPSHYAWGVFAAPRSGAHQIELDLATPRAALDGQDLPLKAGDLRDGAYFAALWVYQGDQVRARLPFLHFERHGNRITVIAPFDLGLAFVPLGEPSTPSDSVFGSTLRLRGFGFDAPITRTGATLQASLLWQAEQPQDGKYLLFVQLLDDANRKAAQWDGPPGGDWWPALGWQPGQRIWQDIPLQIAGDAPPGRYRLIAGLYDPATGERLKVRDGSDSVLLGEVDIQP